MPITFRRSIRLLPGVYLNLNRRSWSISLRLGPIHRTWGSKAVTTSVDLPGPLGYRRTTRRNRREG
jgi:hypothetical protein